MVLNFATEYSVISKICWNTEQDAFKWLHVYHVCIISGLEYKFMVKSVDPDGTTSVTEKKTMPDDAAVSLNNDLHEEEVEEVEKGEYGDKVGEMTSPAPEILEEKRILQNHTGNYNYLNIIQVTVCCCTGVQTHGPNTQMPGISSFSKTAQFSPHRIDSV